MKLIDVAIYEQIFNKRGRESCQLIYCENTDNCSLYNKGQCILKQNKIFGNGGCKYGNVKTETGFTKQARKYESWKRERREQYKEHLNKIQEAQDKLSIIGDFIWIPYHLMGHWKFRGYNKKYSIDVGFGNGKTMIDKKMFDEEFIYCMVTERPQAMMGGEITSYQKETVPLFLQHLKEEMPSLYQSTIEKYPQLKEKVQKYSPVGRKVLVKTLVKGCEIILHPDSYDIRSKWYWDGEYFNYVSGWISSVRIVDNYKEKVAEYKIKPDDDAVIKITNESQVDENTVFVN